MATEYKFLKTVNIAEIVGESEKININYGGNGFNINGFIFEMRWSGIDFDVNFKTLGSVKGDSIEDALQINTYGGNDGDGVRILQRDHKYPFLGLEIEKLTATTGTIDIYLAYY